MDNPKINFSPVSPATSAIVLLLLFAGALYVCVWSPSMSNIFLPYQPNFPSSNFTTLEKLPVKDELDLALEEASMPNKTVIIAVVNKAYVDQSVNAETTMLDLFLESFWLGDDTRPLLDHLLLVAVDQTAYDRCKFKRLHCYRLVTDGVDFGGEKVYMSEDFIKMMWRRTAFLLDVLRRGYSFIFTDTDVMWLRNPIANLSPNQTPDLQISVDQFHGDPRPEKNSINTGFYYIRSNNKTISLFDTWNSQKDNSTGKKEQDVLFDLMRAGLFGQLDLQVKILETRHFSGFCQDSGDVGAVTTVHANCCRHINAKIGDLTAVLRDWKRFKAAVTKYPKVASNITSSFRWSPHIGCMNSWRQ
ncbi:Nucleotide-diphospho-sugar transferase [Corchorus olitorius]|uniref:Nucleotide-diphospho-sugar transferase n=1 Tax=Corchorus olitorius TaxID=93759 RepID=A0A1R3K141_9ROSI|nr:Nucleotide-diphospho-sugar transferase [Corchorus olitorius]